MVAAAATMAIREGAAPDGHEELSGGKRDACDEDGRPDFDHGGEAGERPDEPEGNKDIERKKMTAVVRVREKRSRPVTP